MKETENLDTGIEIRFNSDGNIKSLKSPYDDNEPSNLTIYEVEFNHWAKNRKQPNNMIKVRKIEYDTKHLEKRDNFKQWYAKIRKYGK